MRNGQSPSFVVDVQQMIDSVSIPDKDRIESWVKAALMADTAHNKQPGQDEQELTIRIVGKDEIRNLNKTYRHQDKTTNVLSFPFEAPSQVQLPLLGDIVICHDIVAEEAEQQQKTLFSHWAHMVIHGVLHLKGYDHIEDSEAEIMEALEIKIMEQSGFANPYYEP